MGWLLQDLQASGYVHYPFGYLIGFHHHSYVTVKNNWLWLTADNFFTLGVEIFLLHSTRTLLLVSRTEMAITYALACDSKAVGKRMKNSKRQVVWKIMLQKGRDRQHHEILLKHSILSGKAAVLYDNRDVHKSNKACALLFMMLLFAVFFFLMIIIMRKRMERLYIRKFSMRCLSLFDSSC